MHNYNVDPEILGGFIDESLDGLDGLDSLFLDLEKDPDNTDIVNGIFRPVHSIKGSAAFFGLMNVKTLSHNMEDVLDTIRQKKKFADPDTIKLLLSGLDELKKMFLNVRNARPELEKDETTHFNSLIKNLSDSIKVKEPDTKEAAILFGDLIFKLEEIRSKTNPDISKVVDEAENIISSITPIALKELLEATEDSPVSELSEIIKNNPLNKIQSDQKITDQIKLELEKILLQSGDEPTKKIIESGLSEFNSFMQSIGFDEILKDSLVDKIEELEKKGKWKQKEIKPQPKKEPEKKDIPKKDIPEKTEPLKKEHADKTMRVAEKDIDSFLSFVSELVVVEEMFNYLQKKLSQEDSQIAADFKRVIETFGNLSKNLRDSIFAIRMVSVKGLLQKSQRIVYDVASQTSKKASVEIKGDDTKIDKSYLELLDAPFTHIIRNAVDHGIETTKKRSEKGKDETGLIKVKVEETDKTIDLVIQDDGKGIDYKAISKKALEMGLIQNEKDLDNEALTNFLFMSGVSTAESITDISGRGVGMDVVKRNIEEVGGLIKIDSKENQGSTFTISLPKNVSTQIIDGFLIESGGHVYVLPMDIIGESFAIYREDIKTVENKGEVVIRREQLYQIVRLKEAIEDDYQQETSDNTEIGIVIESEKSRFVVSVDKIIGVQKVVVRNIEGLISLNDIFDGAALLGDGNIAMILGKKGLMQLTSW